MNERIKELAEQAGLKYHNWITNESNINDGDFKYPRLEDYEKFAELIIQKCKSQIALIGISNFENKDIMWTVETAIASIEEHFGVER